MDASSSAPRASENHTSDVAVVVRRPAVPISDEMRAFLMLRRRALYMELRGIERLLGLYPLDKLGKKG